MVIWWFKLDNYMLGVGESETASESQTLAAINPTMTALAGVVNFMKELFFSSCLPSQDASEKPKI